MQAKLLQLMSSLSQIFSEFCLLLDICNICQQEEKEEKYPPICPC